MKRFVCFLGMVKHLMLCVLLVSAASHRVRSEMFTESGLVDIPTGNILSHGTFGTGIFIGYPRYPSPWARYRCDVVAFRFNFGLFDRVEVGLRYLSNTPGPSPVRSAHLKFQLLKEQESGIIPSVAIGIENLSDREVSVSDPTHGHGGFNELLLWSPGDYEPNPAPSRFLAISKTLFHQYSGHLGFASDGERGIFVGLSKEFQPDFARGDITINLEVNKDQIINAGIQYATSSGLQIALGATNLNVSQIRYLAAVSWTNE